MSNVICYNYDSSNNNNNTTPLDKIYQWDRNIMIVIKGLDRLTSTVKVHFANQSGKDALIVTPTGGDIDTTNKILRVRIPNDLLKESGDIFAYIYDSKSGGQGTTYRVRIPVTPRAKDGAAYVNDPSELNNGSFEIEELNITGNVLAEYITARKNITAQEHMYIGNDHVATEAYVGTAVDASSQTLNGRIDVLDGKIQPATKQGQGIVKVGDNISVSDGTISVPTATSSTKGVVRVGDNLKIEDGAIGVDPATKSAKGVVKVGDNISVNNGEISVPTATSSTKGVVKVGAGLNVNNGEISVDTTTIADTTYVDGKTQDATTSRKGVVKVGAGLNVSSGTISVNTDTIATKSYVDTAKTELNNDMMKILFVESLPTGANIREHTIYFVPHGANYDKYVYTSSAWERIGGSSTEVITTLPQSGDSDIDYILKTANGCLYYKWINSSWEMVGGSKAEVCVDLPQTGNEYTDYYVQTGATEYNHYRYFNGGFHLIGTDDSDSITSINSALTRINNSIGELEGSIYTYYQEITTDDNDNNVLILWKVQGDGEPEVAGRVVLPATGGGGGVTPTVMTTITVTKVTESPLVVTKNSNAVISIDYSSIDNDNDAHQGTYSWTKIQGSERTVIKTGDLLYQGRYNFDFTDHIIVGDNTFTLNVSDDTGHMAPPKTWTIRVVDLRVDSSFNDKTYVTSGRSLSFPYTPNGYGVTKTVHFKIDGVETTEELSAEISGNSRIKVIPAKTVGAHFVEVWLTATIASRQVESDHIFRDIIWYNEQGSTPIIGCIYRNDYYGTLTIRQYERVEIPYVVLDPRTNTPTVERYVDGTLVDTSILDRTSAVWNFISNTMGQHTLLISCGSTSVTIVVNVVDLDIDVAPVEGNLEFDFNPISLDNNSNNRLWSNGTYHMSVSNNFDWINGGYKTDENNDSYFLVKAGTRATFDYKMFKERISDCPSTTGAELKVVFMTENVQNQNAVWLTNAETRNDVTIGIQMGVHTGWLKTNNASDEDIVSGGTNIASTNTYLYLPYSEEDIIELDINIDNLDTEQEETEAFVMAYEDGVPSKAFVYNNTDRFYQQSAKNIVIGSDDCDVRIYRLKAYSTSLSTEDIMRNFIADARNIDDMLDRYNRNCIYYNNERQEYYPYSSKGVLTPERLAQQIPNVKVLMLDTDHFTSSKKNFIKSTLRCIHAAGGDVYPGDSFYDNWFFENGYHAGQGTTSDTYGVSGRNVDFLFECDGTHKPSDKVDPEAGYVSRVTRGYGTDRAVTESVTDWKGDEGKVALTRTSVPNNFFNLKVNVASSENVNNALLQKRYNDYLPYLSPGKKRDQRIKNDMEFVPAVLFIRENNPDLTTHTEFNDTNWHFYALGNIGDSKKTDYTRAYDPTDMNEFTIEVSDNTEHNSTFQTGIYLDGNGDRQFEAYPFTGSEPEFVYPITLAEWNDSRNPRRKTLYEEPFDGDNSFEQRYACLGDYRDGKKVNYTSGTEEEVNAQIAKNEEVWRAFYRWVITATDAQFVDELDQWVVPSAMEFFYAFTHMYTMMDNRAKNTFWHFAKTGEYKPVSRPVSELLHVYCEKQGNDYIPTSDVSIVSGKTYYTQYAFDLWVYDTDTAIGINNNGELKFPYGKEDTDYKIDNTPSSGYAFNGATSVFWCRLRDLLPDEIDRTFNSVVRDDCFQAESLINQFDEFQNCYPEEIWRLDIERKYIRPFTGLSVDHSIPKKDSGYLSKMMQGRKKYQRRQWIRDQEVYFGTKHMMSSVTGDDNRIVFRCDTPTGTLAVVPNYTLHIKPYQDMYLSVDYNNNDSVMAAKELIRAKAGTEYTIPCPLQNMTDTQVIIYCANRIQELGDLSSCYITTGSFASATKLKKLIIGNPLSGYTNVNLTVLNVDDNELLEEIDLRNCSGLGGSLNLEKMGNLRKLYAEGTQIRGVLFPVNGRIQIAHLPNTVNTLSIRGLYNTTDFDIPIDTIQVLTFSGNPINTLSGAKTSYDIVSASIDSLITVDLYDINWEVSNTTLLNRLAALANSSLSGVVNVTGRIGSGEIATYSEKWHNLEVIYDPSMRIEQYTVTYVNDDASHTVLATRLVNQGDIPPNLTASECDITPTKTPLAQYTYTFSGWSGLYAVSGNMTVTATYTGTLREYTVRWYSGRGSDALIATTTARYGEEVVYPGELPTDTSGEAGGFYKVFAGWDKSTGCIKGATDVYALWESSYVPPVGTDLSTMTPGQIYAVAKSGGSTSFFEDADYTDITLGHDFDFQNVASATLVGSGGIVSNGELYLDGSHAYDSEIQLFGANERSFTLAVDYSFRDTTHNGTLLSCFAVNGAQGFRLRYNNPNNNGANQTPNIQWGDTTASFGYRDKRDILIIRHIKGDSKLYIYASNSNASSQKFDDDIYSTVITRSTDIISGSTNALTLVFGAAKYSSESVDYQNYGTGIIHWCKVWFDDLGDNNSISLASWPREVLRMEYWANEGDNKYKLAASGHPTSHASFISNNLLAQRGLYMNSTATNDGGWDATYARRWLNNRFFNAIPTVWQSIIQTVQIPASAGRDSTVVNYSNDKIYLPAIKELGGGYIGYSEEESVLLNRIGFLENNYERGKAQGIIIPRPRTTSSGTLFIESTDPTSIVSLRDNVSEGDVWATASNGTFYVFVSSEWKSKNGNSYGTVIDAAYGNGGWLALNIWWTRSTWSTGNFARVPNNGSVGSSSGTYFSNPANTIYGICPCFSI